MWAQGRVGRGSCGGVEEEMGMGVEVEVYMWGHVAGCARAPRAAVELCVVMTGWVEQHMG